MHTLRKCNETVLIKEKESEQKKNYVPTFVFNQLNLDFYWFFLNLNFH